MQLNALLSGLTIYLGIQQGDDAAEIGGLGTLHIHFKDRGQALPCDEC